MTHNHSLSLRLLSHSFCLSSSLPACSLRALLFPDSFFLSSFFPSFIFFLSVFCSSFPVLFHFARSAPLPHPSSFSFLPSPFLHLSFISCPAIPFYLSLLSSSIPSHSLPHSSSLLLCLFLPFPSLSLAPPPLVVFAPHFYPWCSPSSFVCFFVPLRFHSHSSSCPRHSFSVVLPPLPLLERNF